jgi:hypothetical protein
MNRPKIVPETDTSGLWRKPRMPRAALKESAAQGLALLQNQHQDEVEFGPVDTPHQNRLHHGAGL